MNPILQKESYPFFSRRKVSITIAIIAFIGLVVASVGVDKLNALQVKSSGNVMYTKKDKIQIGNGFSLTGNDNNFIEYGMDLSGEICGIGIGRYNDEYSRANIGLFRKTVTDPDTIKIYFIEGADGKQKRNPIVEQKQVPFSIAWHNDINPVAKVGINTDHPTDELHVNGNTLITGNLTVIGKIFTDKEEYIPPVEIGGKAIRNVYQVQVQNQNVFEKITHFDVKEYDTNNTFDMTNGEYVIPINGFYYLSLSSTWNHEINEVNTYMITQIRTNETRVESGESASILAYEYDEYYMSCTTVSRLQKGDKISVYILSADSVDVSVELTVHKI